MYLSTVVSIVEDALRLPFQLKEKQINIKELKEEANNLKVLCRVQEAIGKYFKLKSWEEALQKFGASVRPERLLRFKVNLIVHCFRK